MTRTGPQPGAVPGPAEDVTAHPPGGAGGPGITGNPFGLRGPARPQAPVPVPVPVPEPAPSADPAVVADGTFPEPGPVAGQRPAGGQAAHGRLPAAAARALPALWWQRLPGWLQALLVYAVSRVFDAIVIGRVARFQAASLWNPPDPGYFDIVSLWDGDWYRRIAETGYPASLPIDSTGNVAQNEWAFYPLYPFSVRGVMDLLGTGWPVTASLLSVLYGALAVVVLRSLVDRQAGRELALWTVALFCFFPSAPVLQLAYTESLAMLLLVSALWCLQRRQYLLAVPVVLMIGFERPIAVPVAAVVGVHVLLRIVRHRRDPLPWRSFAAMVVLLLAAGTAAVAWTVVAGRATGTPDAYTQTMAAWRAGHHITLVKPWYWMSRYFLGDWTGPAVIVLSVAVAARVLTSRHARVIAGDLRTWVVAYLGYLALVLDPHTSLARYLVLLFPVGAVFAAASPSRAYRWTLVLAFAAGQILWVGWLWRFSPPADWPP